MNVVNMDSLSVGEQVSSSGGGVQVLPGGGFGVELAALEAGVEDAGPAVGERPRRLAVGFAAGAELAVVGAGPWRVGE